jgi:hypothetical protein
VVSGNYGDSPSKTAPSGIAVEYQTALWPTKNVLARPADGSKMNCGCRKHKGPAAPIARRARCSLQPGANYDAAALGIRLRELRWKNSAWLATAETIAGWNGLDIRNAGSGRSPVRKRSG